MQESNGSSQIIPPELRRWIAAVLAFAWGILLVVEGVGGLASSQVISWSIRAAAGIMVILGLLFGLVAFGIRYRLAVTLWSMLVVLVLWLPTAVFGVVELVVGGAAIRDLVVVGLQLGAFFFIGITVVRDRRSAPAPRATPDSHAA